MMTNYSIITQNLSIDYQNTMGLENISLKVNKGELFGLIGPDGAGKSSLIRILTTVLEPDRGNAWVENYDILKEYKAIRKIVGYMPGEFSLYEDLTVEENLDFFATIFDTTVKENYKFIKGIYKQIEPFKKRKAGQLSGGMKQKLALSCALVHQPKVLFLDEPTTGVDPVSRKEFWEMLAELKSRGITILVATPYMDEASQCDRVALMQEGRILAIDQPENIVRQFGKSLLAIKSKNMFHLVKDLEHYPHTDSVFPFGEYLHYTDKRQNFSEEEIKNYLLAKGHHDLEIRHIAPNIEDCFMELVRKPEYEAGN